MLPLESGHSLSVSIPSPPQIATRLKNPEIVAAIIDDFHKQGIRISIDDFGTGYSSLAYLSRFRIDKLKIDQSFVRNIDTNSENEAIIDAVISMAKRLHLHTIAERVENERELQLLLHKGCEEIQGYFFSRPMPSENIETWINEFSI